MNDNSIRKTSVSACNNDYNNNNNDNNNDNDNDFLPEVEDLISGKHWRSVLTASLGPGHMTAKQPADNRGWGDSVLQSKYGAGAGTRVLVSSKDKYTMF